MDMFLQQYLSQTPAHLHWQSVGITSHHGLCVILSSLRTEKSSGIGEFFDLLPLIEWMKKIKMNILQLLPLNDTAEDQSPYNAISSCALNPIFLSLWTLPEIEKDSSLLSQLEKLKKENHGPIRYSQVREK